MGVVILLVPVSVVVLLFVTIALLWQEPMLIPVVLVAALWVLRTIGRGSMERHNSRR